MNKVLLVGKIASEIVQYQKGSNTYVKFFLQAFNEYHKKRFIPIVVWNRKGQSIMESIKLKNIIAIEGFLDYLTSFNQEGKKIINYNINLTKLKILN